MDLLRAAARRRISGRADKPAEVALPADVAARGRPRPPLFRALGAEEPPARVSIAGVEFALVEVLKHDSWAATAVYQSGGRRAICKFNRQQSILGLPMGWLGRWLAAREARFLDALAETHQVPLRLGDVTVGGTKLRHAVARAYLGGHALAPGEHVDDEFFPRLRDLLAAMHARRMAYVDLHKRENVIVGDDGRPYLIDFQISLGGAGQHAGPLLAIFQQADRYHLTKHWIAHRPEQCGLSCTDLARLRPWPIRLHRLIGVPFRALRRRLLVWLHIRTGRGRAVSEHFAEDALRCPTGSMLQSSASAADGRLVGRQAG